MVRSAGRASKWHQVLACTLRSPQMWRDSKAKTKDNIIDSTEPATCVELLEEANTAFRVLRDSMYPTFALHIGEIRELEDLQELE